jgi:hypothetical protein
MKKMVLVIALVSLALVGNASAQYNNNIGVFLDEAATNNCITLNPFVQTYCYLALTNLTASEVGGWEGKLTFTNLEITQFNHSGQAINAASRPDEYVVGYASPLPVAGGVCVVAQLRILVDNTSPAAFYINETFASLFENGLPAYIDGSGAGYPLYPVSADGNAGTINDPIMVVNGTCLAVAAETSSFGSLKSLFR